MAKHVGNKVVLIGAGDVGVAYAFALINQSIVDHLAIIDIDEKKTAGNVMDLNHGVVWAPTRTRVTKGTYEDCADADMVVICAGAAQKPGETRLDLVDKNVKIMNSIVSDVMANDFDGIFLVASNPVDILTYAVWKASGLDHKRVIGSGTVLDTARMRYLISLETGTATQNIHGYIAGEHGDSEVALWSSTEIGGVPITQWGTTLDGGVFDESKRERIAHDVVRSAYRIIEAHGADAEPARPTPFPASYDELVFDDAGWSQTIIVDGKRPEWLRDDDRVSSAIGGAQYRITGLENWIMSIRVRRREPKRETVSGLFVQKGGSRRFPLSFDLIDGKPDLSTLKIAEDAL